MARNMGGAMISEVDVSDWLSIWAKLTSSRIRAYFSANFRTELSMWIL